VGDARPEARWALVQDHRWNRAVDRVVGDTAGPRPDAALLFVGRGYDDHLPELVHRVWEATGTRALVGCSAQGVIGGSREVEEGPALALMTLVLPGATMRAVRFTAEAVQTCGSVEQWCEMVGVSPAEDPSWLVFGDPLHLDSERWVGWMGTAYPGRTTVGGLASTDRAEVPAAVFLDGAVHREGGVGLAICGPYEVLPIVSQGCDPIGESWTITGARGSVIETIAGRPAYEVLVETFRGLPPPRRLRAQRNLLVGFAADGRREAFPRGSFLVRNLVGAEPRTGALAVGATPRVGQTIQFQIRDAAAADSDLNGWLDQAARQLGDRSPVAAVLCSCTGRGAGLFGAPDHDAMALASRFPSMPVAGFFCSGEIGPVGARPFLHGFTASIGLLVAR
jgi:small ligand-binding sensory domain FIST